MGEVADRPLAGDMRQRKSRQVGSKRQAEKEGTSRQANVRYSFTQQWAAEPGKRTANVHIG
jgi:hypothetical protein